MSNELNVQINQSLNPSGKTFTPFGLWESPLSAATVASKVIQAIAVEVDFAD